MELAGVSFFEPRAEVDRYLKGLVAAGHTGRITFGSDQQLWPQSIEVVETAEFLA